MSLKEKHYSLTLHSVGWYNNYQWNSLYKVGAIVIVSMNLMASVIC